MGHYDDCFAEDAADKAKKDEKEMDEEMKFIWDEALCPSEKKIVLEMARHAYDYLIFFKVIKRLSK